MNSSEKSKSTNKVMLIDDTEVDAFISKRMLTSSQFTTDIMEFYSAKKALEYLGENSHNLSALPRLIFLDINMPAMDGFDFMEKFRQMPNEILQNCKVVMLSSAINDVDIQRINKDEYIVKFLIKPLSREELQELNAELNATIK